MNNPRWNLNATSEERSRGAWDGNGGLSQWGWLEKLKRQKSWLWEVQGRPECWCIKRKTEIWAIYKLKCLASAQLWAPSVGVGKEASHQWTKEPLHAIRIRRVHSVGTQIVLLFLRDEHTSSKLYKTLTSNQCALKADPRMYLLECWVIS